MVAVGVVAVALPQQEGLARVIAGQQLEEAGHTGGEWTPSLSMQLSIPAQSALSHVLPHPLTSCPLMATPTNGHTHSQTNLSSVSSSATTSH